jgi:succinate dehydrogenase flavin-adding protein (antitoxin of CptAB toxin-antitoxin module)
MNKFGTIKTQLLQKITEAYADGKKDEIKNILTEIKKNSDFRDLYLFYEEIENKYFENPDDARQYLKEVRELLINKTVGSKVFCELLDKKIGDIKVEENEIYSHLDTFASRRQLKNADKHIIARNKLVEHLTTKKENNWMETYPIIENEALLRVILTNNFNALYDATLNEEEKKELNEILSISDKELKSNFVTLQEEVTTKMNTMILEEKSDDIKAKLNTAINEARVLKPTKFNYYKLQQLKKGL